MPKRDSSEEQSPKKEATSPPPCRPDGLLNNSSRRNLPMDIVVIRETLPNDSNGSALQPRPTSSIFTGPEGPAPNSASIRTPFRLQPRGTSIGLATPSPSGGSSRGRKRSAQCLVTSLVPGVARDLFSSKSFSPTRTDPVGIIQCIQPKSSPRGRMESAMQSLSIKSPRITRGSNELCSSPSMYSRVANRPGSSFTTYSPSPLGCVRTRAESMNSVGSASKPHCSPGSGSLSSPRLAPLTILRTSGGDAYRTPTQRPPLHDGPSPFLFSLDGKLGDPNEAKTPSKITLQPLAIEAVSPHSESRTSNEYYSSGQRIVPQQRTPLKDFVASPTVGHAHFSPATPCSRRTPRTPHDTPLPSIKLTPRSTSSNGLPRIPSPSNQGQDFSLSELVLVGSPGQRLFLNAGGSGLIGNVESEDVQAANDSRPTVKSDSPLRRVQAPALPDKFDAGERKPPSWITRPRKASYLPVPEWCDLDPEKERGLGTFRHENDVPMHEDEPQAIQIGSRASDGGFMIPGVKTRSLLWPSKSSSVLDDIMLNDERAAAMDDDGSLSDPDEDEPFVLTDPALLVEERYSQGRARQRQRRSYFSSEQNGTRQSSMLSLTSSAHASNTSLLGMDFLRADSTASLLHRDTMETIDRHAPEAPDRLNDPDEPSNDSPQDLKRRRSEASLESIGLALDHSSEGKEETGRDLVTPPAMVESSASPPPLSNDEFVDKKVAASTSVCFSRSDPDAVNFTIAKMIFQSHVQHSPEISVSSK